MLFMAATTLAITVPEDVASQLELAAHEDSSGDISAIATEALRAYLRARALDRAMADQEGPMHIPDDEVAALWRKYGLD
jgi:predicted transcriptional regulator